MYAVDGFRRKAGGVVGDVIVLDGCAVNCIFPCMRVIRSERGGGGVDFVQGLSEVSGHRDVARTAALVP